ncbi:thiol:disulfide interchange protein DsbA/DsbL [Celerinatantimonas sp. YJH-8]|uniref:thiol:disulfide interchange protein DsbA/DsbL n=1 Tax=Celerinatantimonas sp. YJH-8 TaxID=3228714 RepID=UPI0038C25E3A
MKKLLICLFALCLIPLAHAATGFKEGVNYTVVRQQATEHPQVMEFFSYYCPHCFAFEPIIAELKKDLPKNVEFQRNHVAFLGGAMGEEMVRAYAVAEILEVTDKITPAIFKAIHIQRKPIESRDDIRQIFVDNGVSGADFDSAVDSFAVNGLVAQMDKNTRDFRIQGVPTVIVNGKYEVNPGSVKSADEYINLVKYLVTQKD